MATSPDHIDIVDCIMRWEGGDIPEAEVPTFFQHLIDTGLVNELQGIYQKTAAALIRDGLCHAQGATP